LGKDDVLTLYKLPNVTYEPLSDICAQDRVIANSFLHTHAHLDANYLYPICYNAA